MAVTSPPERSAKSLTSSALARENASNPHGMVAPLPKIYTLSEMKNVRPPENLQPITPNVLQPSLSPSQPPLMKLESPSSIIRIASTALPSRTEADMFADLKRPLHAVVPSPKRQQAQKSCDSDDPQAQLAGLKLDAPPMLNPDDHEGYPESEDDEDEDVARSTKPRKISERKRRLDAIAESFLQEKALKELKEDVRLSRRHMEDQSARYIVHQGQSQQIISTPREYQTEIFERAKERNIIAVLDTGSGKTLIAVLLLRHIFAQELEDRARGMPKRVSFFLVDSVTLVFQQHAVLKANLDQPMNMFCGDMNAGLLTRKSWEKHFNENMVIVCTAEVLRQCLHRSFISMDQINLLIFDEAHHAKKGHPYASIIKDFYIQKDKQAAVPKIFGMTASPVDARVDVKKAAAELETLLHCEIATTADAKLREFAGMDMEEKVARYAPLGPAFETPLLIQMMDKLKTNKVFKKPLTFSREATRELGSWCADQIWQFCMSDEEIKKLQARTERSYHARKVAEPLEILEQRKIQLADAQAIIKAHPFSPPDFKFLLPSQAVSNNLSSKVVLLVQYLKERFERPTEDRCIVFVSKRYTARALAELLSIPSIGTPHLHVSTLVGTRKGDAGDSNVSFRDQVITMMNFRKGIINCLFATSVAEEGLDIPDCNLVIRFDLYTTLIQYIQSRGRARHANSRYIHMVEERNIEQRQLVAEVRRNEDILKRVCAALPEDRKVGNQAMDLDRLLAKESKLPVYTIPETGAKLNYKVGLLYLADFVSSLPHGPGSMLSPEYVITVQNKMFICEAMLPEESPIRGAIGRPSSTKQIAKCSAAFETCLLLRKGKYFDEHFKPIFKKQLPAMRNALLAVDSKKRAAYDMRTKPECWAAGSVPEQLFITILSLDTPESLNRPSQPLALLTRTALPQLPSFILHFGAGKKSSVQPKSFSQSIKVERAVLDQLTAFTLCVFEDIFSKAYEPDVEQMPYFLAPVKQKLNFDLKSINPRAFIAWDTLKSISDYQSKWSGKPWELMDWKTQTDEFFEEKFVVDPWDGSRKFWLLGLAPQYTPLDPLPPDTLLRKGPRKALFNSNIMEYSCSLWAKAREKSTFDVTQRVFRAEHVSLKRNLLDESDPTAVEETNKCCLILEPLRVSPLPGAVVAMAYNFPAIIHRLEAYLIALEAAKLLSLEIRPDLALEAVTKDSDNSEEHGEEKINFQRGMGNNYERLEFLGDCFLKMATSISLYGIFPDKDEYSYHVERMMLICNKNLCDNAIKLKLFEYIRSQQFNRRAWYPEGLKLLKGKTAKAADSHSLGDKSIADVCEAMIGAALLTRRDSGDMDNAVRAVTELVSSENHRATAWSDYYELYKKPQYQLARATAAQLDLARQVEERHAYHFTYPRVLRSAFIHPSYPFSYEKVPNYQRLEFLGDALLDMACINFLYYNFPAHDPQWLTEHKMAMVSNQFLGALCVKLGFHRHLLIFNSTFQKQIYDYVDEITLAQNQAEDDAERGGKSRAEYSPDYWTSVRSPPKCLPDVVEAYVGAIFVDSEYDYKEVERFFDEHVKWYFTDMSIYDTYAKKHPTTFLTNFLQVSMGCMDWTVIAKEEKVIDGSKPRVVAMVLIHSEVVAHYQAESSRYAKVGAAKKALQMLKGLPLPEYRSKYQCNCRVTFEGEEQDAIEEAHLHGTAI